MKVICINEGWINPSCQYKDIPGIKEGEIYTVIALREGFCAAVKRTVYAYQLKELPGLYERGLFITLSEIDETEFVRETIKEKQITN